MKCVRQTVQKCFAFVIIPLTLFGGRSTGGCICPDGHFKLFCSGGHCCSQENKSVSHTTNHAAGCCCSTDNGTGTAGIPSCSQHRDQSVGDCEQMAGAYPPRCHQLVLSPMLVAPNHIAPLDSNSWTISVPESLGLAILHAHTIGMDYQLDIRPPRARLNLLQRFLI
jgi:hypothetical protein